MKFSLLAFVALGANAAFANPVSDSTSSPNGKLKLTAATLRESVAGGKSGAFAPDGTELPRSLVLERRWSGPVCESMLENRGKLPVKVGSIVLSEFRHGLAEATPIYGEGFTMLSQTGGTLGKPSDEGFLTDRTHYRIPEPGARTTVYGMMTLRPSADRAALIGFTSCKRFAGRISFDKETLSISLDAEGLVLEPGAKWSLEPLRVDEGPDRNTLLDSLASDLARQHPPIFQQPVATGWCSWYCFGPSVNATQIRGNLEWAKQHFPSLRYIQIDDGYQPWMGDWLETGKSFGGDIRSVLKEIRALDFEPAIWLAPFVASPQSKLFQQHPDWFIKDAEGKPLASDQVTFGGWRLGPWYALDGTHPDALRWLENTFRTMREDWGCTYFKLDANFWGTMHGGHFHDPSATRVEAYRRGMEAIRRGAGDTFILGCNHPIWPSLGLIHGSRSSMDIKRDWEHIAKTGRENLLRSWQNGRLWWNDPDALCLNNKVLVDVPDAAGKFHPIGQATDDELLFHATLLHATGGMVLTGDDMRTYGDVEKARLAELCPPSGKAMRFDSEDFTIGRSEDGKSVALLNWSNEPRDFTVPLSHPAKIREVWTGKDFGLKSGEVRTEKVPARSGRLLRLEIP